MSLTGPTAAAVPCRGLLNLLLGRPRTPAIAKNLGVAPLENLRWTETIVGTKAEFRSPWGTGTVLINELSLTVSLRPVGGDVHLSPGVLAELRRRVGRIDYREDREVSFEYEGFTDRKTGWVSLHLKREWHSDFEPKARDFLKFFFGECAHRAARGDIPRHP